MIGDGSERKGLQELSARLDLTAVVHWRGAIFEWSELSALLRGVDLVVLPDIGGLGLVDAFACARGVVVSKDSNANPPEAGFVVDGQSGFRYQPHTAEALADLLFDIYSHPEQLVSVSKAAGRQYNDALTLDKAVSSFATAVRRAQSGGTVV